MDDRDSTIIIDKGHKQLYLHLRQSELCQLHRQYQEADLFHPHAITAGNRDITLENALSHLSALFVGGKDIG